MITVTILMIGCFRSNNLSVATNPVLKRQLYGSAMHPIGEQA